MILLVNTSLVCFLFINVEIRKYIFYFNLIVVNFFINYVVYYLYM